MPNSTEPERLAALKSYLVKQKEQTDAARDEAIDIYRRAKEAAHRASLIAADIDVALADVEDALVTTTILPE